MSLADDLRQSLRTMESYTGDQSFRWKDATYPCNVSTEQRGTVYEAGGKMAEIQMTLIVRGDVVPIREIQLASSALTTSDSDAVTADAAGSPPWAGGIVWFKERKYRIAGQVRNDPQAGFYRMDLVSANR